jgi:acetylglutamate kinase
MKNLLIKLGGSVITDSNYRKRIIKQLIEIKNNGYNICVVHGGGKLISHYLTRLDIKSEFYEGIRITSDEAVDVVMMVLTGKVNKDIVKDFNSSGEKAVGLCGGDGNLIQCEKLVINDSVDLGNVGYPTGINADLYKTLSDAGYIVVVATIGQCESNYYNINADHTAAFMAQKIKANHLIYVSDVDGVMHPDTGELFSQLDKEKINKLKNEGIISAGMLPKLNSCLDALNNGVSQVFILNGKRENSIADTVLNNRPYGTEILLTH